MAPVLSLLALGALTLNAAFAHPGQSVAEEAKERAQWLRTSQPNSVRNCAASLRRSGQLEAALTRRQEMAFKARAKRGLVARSFEQYNISHAGPSNIHFGDDERLLFADNSSCLLQPEVTQGPYLIDGELIRSDMTEDQEGIPLYLDVQLVDTSDCSPVTAVYVDAWHCNATGVYSGVINKSNGNPNDTGNVQTTFNRALQQTDSNGVVQYQTIFPGHYTGRAVHIHLLSHPVNSTIIRTNSTILDGEQWITHASHVGQIFFDYSLIQKVEATAPYNTNTQELTLNEDDDILIAETEGSDPFVEYVLVNPDNIKDGILAWISLGIDPTADKKIKTAGTVYKEGAVQNWSFKDSADFPDNADD